jgi:hypothetical protein
MIGIRISRPGIKAILSIVRFIIARSAGYRDNDTFPEFPEQSVVTIPFLSGAARLFPGSHSLNHRFLNRAR